MDPLRDAAIWALTHQGEVFVGLVVLIVLSTTLYGTWLIVIDPLAWQIRLWWRAWRQRRADRRVVRERVERMRLEAALHAPMNGEPRPWPPRQAGEHRQPWRSRNGDAA